MAQRSISQRLPYDVLREVVLYTYTHTMQCLNVNWEVSFDLQVPSPPIPASQVCHTWRNALLSDPTMWSSLFVPKTKPNGVLELLARSGSAPLSVFLIMEKPLDTDDEETNGMLHTLFQQIHRFKVLRVQINFYFLAFTPIYDRMEATTQTVLSYLQQPAPNLRTFSIWYKNFSSNDHDLDEGVHEDLITYAFFSGDAPNLQQLHYSLGVGCPKRPEFRNLSELYVSFDGRFQNLLDLIASSPRLKVIHILSGYHWMGDVDTRRDLTHPKVDLPCLQSLALEVSASPHFLCSFFEHITFPPDLKWSIIALHSLTNLNDSPSLLQLISQAHFVSLRLEFRINSVQTIYGEEPSFNELEIAYFPEGGLENHWRPLIHTMQSSRITHLHIAFSRWTMDYLPALQDVLSVCDLESLTVEQQCDNDRPWLACIMILTPILKKITVCVAKNVLGIDDTTQGPGLEFMNSIVGSANDDIIPPTTATLPCPRLRKLNLKLNRSLSALPVISLRTFIDTRKHPLQLSIQCPTLDDDFRRALCPEKDSPVQVSINSGDE